MKLPWSRNDELFFDELRSGHHWQYMAALYFALHDLPVAMPDLSIRDGGIENAGSYLHTFDLRVCGHRVECKSRNERFTNPNDFPYPDAFVDTVHKYNARPRAARPLAYVFISRPTGAMLCVQGRVPTQWKRVRRFDRVRLIDEEFYACPREQLRSLDVLITHIQEQEP